MLSIIKTHISQVVSGVADLEEKEVFELLEVPKQLTHGHLAFPVFTLAKKFKKAPPMIAQELTEKLQGYVGFQIGEVSAIHGFVNFKLRPAYMMETLLECVFEGGDKLGFSTTGHGQKLVIDYSSPNVAKPMHVGHLRASMIGQAIRNLAVTQGFDVEGVNHLGDWGVQFGKLVWAYRKWGEEYDFANNPFRSLYDIYVRFHEEAEGHPEMHDEGSLIFKKLEQGDKEIEAIWKKFVDITLVEDQRLWDQLGVKHESVLGESFYNDKLADVEKRLEDKKLLVESEGAQVVELGEEMPPCLIRKSDGASLYATRDLAAAIYRKEVQKADLNLYVVGSDQNLHFKQVFAVLDKMGYEWAKDCHHISFGMYRFKDQKLSTRKGNVIFLEEVISRAVEMALKVIEEKNPDLQDKEKVAKQVGIGALVFNDLVNDRNKNVEIDWDRLLDFEGDSGPYVQYCGVRCLSILRKAEIKPVRQPEKTLESDEEMALMLTLLQYEETLKNAFYQFKPSILSQYLLGVCRDFSQFYHKQRVMVDDEALKQSRVSLVYATSQVLRHGLKVLSMELPEAM